MIDKYTGAVSMFDVRESVVVSIPHEEQQPVTVGMPLTVVSLWLRSDPEVPERGTTRLWLAKPGEDPKEVSDLDVDLETAGRSRTLFTMGALILTGSGSYVFTVGYKGNEEPLTEWSEVAKLPLSVTLEVEEPNGQGSGPESGANLADGT